MYMVDISFKLNVSNIATSAKFSVIKFKLIYTYIQLLVSQVLILSLESIQVL